MVSSRDLAPLSSLRLVTMPYLDRVPSGQDEPSLYHQNLHAAGRLGPPPSRAQGRLEAWHEEMGSPSVGGVSQQGHVKPGGLARLHASLANMPATNSRTVWLNALNPKP